MERVSSSEWIAGLAITACIFYMYSIEGNAEQSESQGRSAILWMVSRWRWEGADMSHGWLIPLVSGFLVWRKRDELRKSVKCVDWRGLWPFALSIALYLIGMRVQQTRLVLASLIGVLWAIPFFAYGRAVAGLLLFPCAYLVFCIPFTFLDGLTLPLRLFNTVVSTELLNGLGIPVTRAGTAMYVQVGSGFALDVAHPCSGLRYLTAMVAIAAVYAYLTFQTVRERTLLTLLSLPVAMIANTTRIFLIAVVGVVFGEKAATGFYHDYSGYVVFAVAILLTSAAARLMEKRHKREAQVGP